MARDPRPTSGSFFKNRISFTEACLDAFPSSSLDMSFSRNEKVSVMYANHETYSPLLYSQGTKKYLLKKQPSTFRVPWEKGFIACNLMFYSFNEAKFFYIAIKGPVNATELIMLR